MATASIPLALKLTDGLRHHRSLRDDAVIKASVDLLLQD